ncbi:XRE family transcriptional regulator [Ruminococcus sp. AM16-34]|nr:XRE family transcriptional regulator [Ruminococcus sp. AM16-34]
MTFGEKIRSLRKGKKMSQQELASMVGVSYRTIRSWEVEGRYPKQNILYQKLADALQCDVSYLMSENASFITEASEQFGNRGAKQAQQILEQAAAMFAGGSLSDEDKIAFMDDMQMLYLDSKRRAKKYTPKKYLKEDSNEE